MEIFYSRAFRNNSIKTEQLKDGIIANETIVPAIDRYADIREHVIIWSTIDGFIFILILCGNCLTIAAVQLSRRLRSVVSNLFILSLAISDLVVGLTIPYHLVFYIFESLRESHFICIMKFFFNIVACCVSVWNLIAIAVDRYIAIVYPLHYSRWITRRVAVTIIAFGWLMGGTIAVIPVFWNNWETSVECEFDEILPPWYMAGIITPVFSLIWLCMLILYWRIWREAYKHAKQLRASITGLHDSGHSDWKSVQVVILILGCFTVCWLPYFVVACAQIFRFDSGSSLTYYKAAFSLAMANSGMNPIIYAWKNRTFRRAFSHLLRCKAPDSHALIDDENARNNLKRKSSSLPPSLSAPPPTPNSIISATPPPLTASSTDSYRRSSLNRYQINSVTAFPLPPLPPSPQSPMYVVTPLTKCCLKVIDMNNPSTFDCGCEQQQTNKDDIDNNNDVDEHTTTTNRPHFLHPNQLQWDKSQNIFNCNELFLHKLTYNSPAESIVSAPLTPTAGNLIVNILENLENEHRTETMDRKYYRNSTNCVIRHFDNIDKLSTTFSESITQTVSTAVAPIISTLSSPIDDINLRKVCKKRMECVIALNGIESTETVLKCYCTDSSITNKLIYSKSYSKSISEPKSINYLSE